MKKKFIAILKDFKCEVIRFEHWKNNFDWNNYEIEYKNKNGELFLWDGETDIWDEDANSITNKHGILDFFKKSVSVNCV